jgi:hypothetical protein
MSVQAHDRSKPARLETIELQSVPGFIVFDLPGCADGPLLRRGRTAGRSRRFLTGPDMGTFEEDFAPLRERRADPVRSAPSWTTCPSRTC